MTAKFDNFLAALERLCVEHGVSIGPTMYDGLVVRDANGLDAPVDFPGVDDRTGKGSAPNPAPERPL